MSKLIEKIISDPNSPFSEDDVAELSKMKPATLKRLAIGMQTQDIAVSNASLIEARMEDLENCQKDLMEIIGVEQSIRQELKGLGVSTNTVLEQFVPVHNQAKPNAVRFNTAEEAEDTLTALRKSGFPIAYVIEEALAAREQSRQKSIETIVHNSGGQFTHEELRRKYTPELQKLAACLENARQSSYVPVHNYDGAAMADFAPSGGLTGVRQFGQPLDLPSTFQ